MGYIDALTYRLGRLYLAGWYGDNELTLEVGQNCQPLRRRLRRPDVTEAGTTSGNHSVPVLPGFNLEVTWAGEPVTVICPDGTRQPLPVPGRMQHAHWQLRVLGRIVRTAVTQGPAVAINLLRRRNIDRDTLRQQLGLASAPSAPTLLDNSLFTRRVLPPVPPDTAITVVLPVYNAFELLQESLHRIEAYTDLPWHLIAVEDCSPDNRVRSWLRDWTATRSDHVTLLENEQNLGFIGSVNRAFQVAPKDRPLVLLNSDALVPEGWASRIVAPILADPGIASVTPMSNDATIFSLPVIGLSSGIPNGLADRLDRTARGLSDALTAPAPTGVGFCMAMSGRALATVGQFDTVFGKGYGEEVDWCQRILRDHGLRHVGIGNLFVEHRGGQSFGSEAKMALIRANGRLISTRYPAFDQDVQDYIAADPLRGHRIALALDWAAGMATDQGARLPVYVAHSMGGGAESWLRGTLAADLDSTLPAAVVIRLGNATRYLVELHTKGSVSRVAVNDTAVLRRLLAPVAGNRLIYSCGVGDPYGIEIPGLIRDLAGPEGRIEVLVHDYWPVSPSYTLVDADGIFHGVPALDSYDSAHQGIDAAGRKVTLADWQAEWGRLILAANEVRVFSNSSARIIRQVWPALGDTLVVRGHQTDTQGLAIADPDWLDDTPGTIAVLGAIGAYKGALYLSQVAAAFQKLPDAPRLVVIGEFDLSFPLPASVTVTGRYHPEDLPGLIRQHRVQAWLMPSIVPETFSFATHEMLATGLPVMSFDLGAQGDTVAAAPNGHILPDRTAPTLLRLFRQITGKAG